MSPKIQTEFHKLKINHQSNSKPLSLMSVKTRRIKKRTTLTNALTNSLSFPELTCDS